MSDFIYSRNSMRHGFLTSKLHAIYDKDYPPVQEYHGDWGSLAVSDSHYHGFQVYETKEHICVVMGGPVLEFHENTFIQKGPNHEGTKAIYERWIEGRVLWDEDLSGPFSILILNKQTSEVRCITDLMSFIPVYCFCENGNVMLSTHVDVLAIVSGQQQLVDMVSKVDFILHGVVTFPYTVYQTIRQLQPASMHVVMGESADLQSIEYWTPDENYRYHSIEEAATIVRQSIQRYVDIVVSNSSSIAQFISGGEDSRALAALLPSDTKHDAFVFLDSMNREGKVAKSAAQAYNANFILTERGEQHYLDILPTSSDLVGEGAQYFHAHTLGFHTLCKLNKYDAVFGGLFSDALLKGARIKKIRGSRRVPFIPQIKWKRYSVTNPISHPVFTEQILEQVVERRKAHFEYVRKYREDSAVEWFELWPSSMNMNIANLHVNRRLFRSYEPFMSKDVVKVSAAVPQSWKLNRRLFHKAAKPLLKPTKWLFHSEGRLPYFPWYINSFIQFGTWLTNEMGVKMGLIKGNQGPWNQWDELMNSKQWKQAIETYSSGVKQLLPVLQQKDVFDLFEERKLTFIQRINLMQTLYCGSKQENK